MAIDQSCGCAVLRGAPPRCCSAMMAFLSPPIPARARATRCAPRCAVDPPAHAADPPPSDAVARNNARAQLFRHLDELQNNLSLAVKRERFADAARLRDQIHSLRLSDEYCRTEIALSNAVDEQRFGDAARLRDVLNTLDPPPVSAAERKQARATRENAEQLSSDVARLTREQAPASSVTRTHSICVRAESYYLPEQSAPEHNRYLFGYKITISNESKHVCQLVSRHWIIGSAGNADSHVKGAGVVGRQPVLMPGESFEYTSACPISSSLQPSQCVVGSMRGHFLFCRGDTGDIRFMVNIDPFYMQLPFHHFKMSS